VAHQRILVNGDHPCWHHAAGADHELPDFQRSGGGVQWRDSIVTLALGTRLVSNGGGNVTPGDLPILRRDLLQEDDFFVLLEDGDKIVITFGTFDFVLLEEPSFPLQVGSGQLLYSAN